MIKKCKVCKKEFEAKGARKYCSKKCADSVVYYELKGKYKNESLCWTCQNFCSGCDWSRSFKPVSGWEAVKTTINDNITSYNVIKCPKYIRG